jgi:hypothetical protein
MRRGGRGESRATVNPIPAEEKKLSSEEEIWKSDNSDGYDSDAELTHRHNIGIEGLTSSVSESYPRVDSLRETDSEYTDFLFSDIAFNYDFKELLHSWRGGSYSRVFSEIKRPENRWVAIKVLISGFKFADKRTIMKER